MLGHNWMRNGSTWKTILDGIQPLIQNLAKTWNAEVTRERWDAPQIELRWYAPDNIGRAIQILIEGEPGAWVLHITASAWKDFDTPRERKWTTQGIDERIPVPHPQELDLEAIKTALEDKVHPIVSGWGEGDLKERSPLPPHDPSLTGKIVEGRYIP